MRTGLAEKSTRRERGGAVKTFMTWPESEVEGPGCANLYDLDEGGMRLSADSKTPWRHTTRRTEDVKRGVVSGASSLWWSSIRSERAVREMGHSPPPTDNSLPLLTLLLSLSCGEIGPHTPWPRARLAPQPGLDHRGSLR